MRSALGMALALGRSLVLPPLWCGVDRVWFPHRGVFPGSQLTLPFQCPVDHVIEIQRFVTTEPKFKVLEHSFLDNPRVDPQWKQSQVDVYPGIDLQWGANASAVRAALGKHAQRNVLRFESVIERTKDGGHRDVFRGFDDPGESNMFEQRLMHAGGVWGTAMSRPGHVHYDFFADRVPWTDKLRRFRNTTWTIAPGEQSFGSKIKG
uniref:Uncharacterized protein n=1 Tax=Pyramimonas obovata TaxID=1411642 RepID=A0A7S0QXJ7_9CHLO